MKANEPVISCQGRPLTINTEANCKKWGKNFHLVFDISFTGADSQSTEVRQERGVHAAFSRHQLDSNNRVEPKIPCHVALKRIKRLLILYHSEEGS